MAKKYHGNIERSFAVLLRFVIVDATRIDYGHESVLGC